jgi:hypothetical protein
MKTTFLNGPLDPRKSRPLKFVQILACDGVNTDNRPDQVDRSVKHGTYVLAANSEDGPIYEWKGVPR